MFYLKAIKKRLLFFFYCVLGIILQKRRQKNATILMYHSVANQQVSQWIDPANHVSEKNFRKQMEFLARKKHVISLDELVSLINSNSEISPNTVVITFDDGYLDNLTIAAPILDDLGLKATLYLPVDYIRKSKNPWVDELYTLMKTRTIETLVYNEKEYCLCKRMSYISLYRKICLDFINMEDERRDATLKILREKLRPKFIPSRLTMNFEEVKTLLHEFSCFEIGSHSLYHSNMAILSADGAKNELKESKEILRRELSRSIESFSFCYGRTNEKLREQTKQLGYSSSCGGDGLSYDINQQSDLYRLPRIDVPENLLLFKIIMNCSVPIISKKIMQYL